MRNHPLLLVALGAAMVAMPAAAVPIIPVDQSTSTLATVEVPPLADLDFVNPQDAKAIFDNSGLHAQSAGRSRLEVPQTIAANGSFVATSFTERDVRAQGQAEQSIRLVAPAGQLTMHFVLPRLLLEFSDNVERLGVGGQPFGGDMLTQIQANICVTAAGMSGCPFELVATLAGHFGEQQLSVQASTLDPGLDLSAFDNQTPTVTGNGFLRTATWEFPAFEGDLDLSGFTGGVLQVTYTLVAIATGPAAITTAAAAINDPFLFETDPTAGSPIRFDFAAADATAVPAPGGLGLLAMTLCGFAVLRRRCA